MQMSVHVNGQNLEMRVIDGSLYSNAAGHWQSTKTAVSTDGSSPDVSDYMTYLRAVANDVKQEGVEQIRGVDTTHFSATLDLKKAMDAANITDAQRKLLKSVVDALDRSTFPVDVWIDSNGLLRKISLKFDAPTSDAGVAVDVTVEFYDFGTPVNVEAPAGATDETYLAQDRAAQVDLRNALTAEKTYYTDNMEYSADAKTMKTVESSLDWGGKLTVVVGDVPLYAANTVCLSEQSASGTNFVLADVAIGDQVGTYYARGKDCPADAAPAELAKLGSSFGVPSPGQTSVSATGPGVSDSVPSVSPPSSATASDLRNALTAEKTYYTDMQTYSASASEMRQIESSLDWGGKLKVVASGDGAAVCVSEASAAGSTFALFDAATSTTAGTSYGRTACPAVVGDTPPTGFVSTGW
jgi:hypothetical protein